MGKRGKYDDAVFETGSGAFDLEATIEDRGESKARYEAPGAQQKWRARDLIDIHWKLTGIECPAESYRCIMSCIIGHANPNAGTCYPRHSTIAIETGYSTKTVKRAIRWWEEHGFLKTESRGRARALAYHPQWTLLESFWLGVASEIDEQKASGDTKGTYDDNNDNNDNIVTGDTKGTYAGDTKGTYDEGHHGDLHNLKVETSKEESHPERVRPPKVADTTPVEDNQGKEKEGNQEEPFMEASSSSETQKEAAAHSRLEADLLRLPRDQCSAVIEWLPYPSEVYDAAVAAEIEAPNAGIVILLDAYRKEKAA